MRRRLLLVDDDDSIREIAKISLERVGGWQVATATSGEEAVEIVTADSAFDAVLLDVMMPGLDGPSTLQRLREGLLVPGTRAIFLTAKVQAADRQRLEALGAAAVIAKPFDPMTLSDEVDRVVAG